MNRLFKALILLIVEILFSSGVLYLLDTKIFAPNGVIPYYGYWEIVVYLSIFTGVITLLVMSIGIYFISRE